MNEILINRKRTFTEKVTKVSEVFGAITCDGFKCSNVESKFYDFVLHFIERPKQSFTNDRDWKVSTRVLVIIRHDGLEEILSICMGVVKTFRNEYDINLSFFFEFCSIVTE